MRVLFLHPEDLPWCGEWSQEKWDLIVDIGFAGTGIYADWSRRTGARVLSLHQFAGQTDSYRWINRVMEPGRGRLLDRMGLDWWEIAGIWNYQELQALYLVYELQREFGSATLELAASRRHLSARLLSQTSKRPIRYFRSETEGPLRRILRRANSAREFSLAQIAEIAFDKWDPNYRIRRHVGRRAGLDQPVVLLPSAYSNVTRIVLAYAAQLPNRRFLLATTRRSGVPARFPANVTSVKLAAYVLPSPHLQRETGELTKAWEVFEKGTLSQTEELRQARDAGVWAQFPAHLKNGLRLREAWKCLMEQEPVKGVLCGDDLNYYTRLPLILAKRMGLSATYCSHGALDGASLFKKPYADSHLVKGEMERDYLIRTGSVDPAGIVVSAPGDREVPSPERSRSRCEDGAVVFFSQPYEVDGGRTEEIYREVLPGLCSLARQRKCRVLLKLHPFESERNRGRLLQSFLTKSDRALVEIVSRVPASEIMGRAWCGVGLDSSVAVECTLKEIPFFLCGWLDFSGLGYMQQFARFGAGKVLSGPEEIVRIPDMISLYKPDRETLAGLWSPGDAAQLGEILFAPKAHAAAHVPVER
jgi:hypothetical protein